VVKEAHLAEAHIAVTLPKQSQAEVDVVESDAQLVVEPAYCHEELTPHHHARGRDGRVVRLGEQPSEVSGDA